MNAKAYVFVTLLVVVIVGAGVSQNLAKDMEKDPLVDNTKLISTVNTVWILALIMLAGLFFMMLITRAQLKAEIAPKKKLKGIYTRGTDFTDEMTLVLDYQVELPYNPNVNFWDDENFQQAVLSARMDWRRILELNATGDVFKTPDYEMDEKLMEESFEDEKPKRGKDKQKDGDEVEEKKVKKHVHIRKVPQPSKTFSRYGELNPSDYANNGIDIFLSGLPPTDEQRKERARSIIAELEKTRNMLSGSNARFRKMERIRDGLLQTLGLEKEDGTDAWKTKTVPMTYKKRAEMAKNLQKKVAELITFLSVPELRYREMVTALEKIRELAGPRIDENRTRWSYVGLWKPHAFSDGRGALYEMIISHREAFEAEFPQVDMIDDKVFPPFPSIIQASPVWLVQQLYIQPDLPLVVPMITLKDALRCAGEISNKMNVIPDALDVMKRFCGFLRAQQSPDALKILSLENDVRWAQSRAEQEHNRCQILRDQLDDKEDITSEEERKPAEPIVINAGKGVQIVAAISIVALAISWLAMGLMRIL